MSDSAGIIGGQQAGGAGKRRRTSTKVGESSYLSSSIGTRSALVDRHRPAPRVIPAESGWSP